MIVFRDCTGHYHTPQCEVKLIENQRIKMCYETCDTDGCNAGNEGEKASPYMESNNAIVSRPFVVMLLVAALVEIVI